MLQLNLPRNIYLLIFFVILVSFAEHQSARLLCSSDTPAICRSWQTSLVSLLCYTIVGSRNIRYNLDCCDPIQCCYPYIINSYRGKKLTEQGILIRDPLEAVYEDGRKMRQMLLVRSSKQLLITGKRTSSCRSFRVLKAVNQHCSVILKSLVIWQCSVMLKAVNQHCSVNLKSSEPALHCYVESSEPACSVILKSSE